MENLTQTQEAANHFIELYSEEIEANEVTPDTIHEWWGQTVDQYPVLTMDDLGEIEGIITAKINS
jgi:hypothetical protein